MIIGTEELDAREPALVAVTREAGELARELFSKPIEVRLKGKQDYITEADGQVERMIISRLKARFPDDAFLGEEGGADGNSDRLWVIDPIDGTANFAHAIPPLLHIDRVHGRERARGNRGADVRRALSRARLGRGAFLNDRAMRVTDTDIKQAVVELGWSSRRPVRAYTSLIERVLATGATFLRAGSGALGLGCARSRVRSCGPHPRLLRTAHQFVGYARRAADGARGRRMDRRFPGQRRAETRQRCAGVRAGIEGSAGGSHRRRAG